jgi:DNA-binding transcriptional MerR regulator
MICHMFLLTVTLFAVNDTIMNELKSAEQLAEQTNDWCEQHGVKPANGQTGERITVRNIRYYRTLGLLDGPLAGGGQGFGEKHRLQLIAIRLLQAQGLPLGRIQELLYGRSLKDLQEIESRGLAELDQNLNATFQMSANESWGVMPLNEEFMLISRHGRKLPSVLKERLVAILNEKDHGTPMAKKGRNIE